jgi:aspartate kinase
VIHHQHGDLLTGGTDIEGEFESLVDLHERRLVCLTVAGRAIRNSPGDLSALSTALADEEINVQTVASGMDSISFYLDGKYAEQAEALLHDEVVEDTTLSSVTLEESIAVIRVTGGDLRQKRGAVNALLTPLADERIYLHDVITSATSISIFVPWDHREEALELVRDVM